MVGARSGAPSVCKVVTYEIQIAYGLHHLFHVTPAKLRALITTVSPRANLTFRLQACQVLVHLKHHNGR